MGIVIAIVGLVAGFLVYKKMTAKKISEGGSGAPTVEKPEPGFGDRRR